MLLAGGTNGIIVLASAEHYAPDLGVVDNRRPQISGVNEVVSPGEPLQLVGTRFTGDSEASGGGTNSSATNSPLVQLRRLDNDQIVWATPIEGAIRSDTSYRSAPLTALPLGPYALTMFVNGISSSAKVIRLVSSHTVIPAAGSNGAITPAAAQTVADGATVDFTVTPAAGYHIASVSGCSGALSGNTYTTGPVTADCAVTASFAINTYTVTASAGANGTIAPSSQTVNHGATTSFVVTPDTGYQINGASGCGGALSGNTYTTGPVTADCTVTASFAINTYTVTASAGANGTIAPTSQTVNHGATTSFAVTPATGYHINSVNGCGGALSGNTYTTGPVTADCTVTASFAINTYTVTASAGANGTIAPATQTVNHGATTSFAVTPATGYHINSVNGCGGALSGNTYTSGPVTADCTVTASFAINTYTVTASAGANGTIAPISQTVNHGATTSFALTPDTGYHINSVNGCGGALSGNTYTTGPVTADCTVTASFAINTYTVTASAVANGTIAPASQTVNHGATTSFAVTPATGYHIADVSGCGGTLSGNTYTTGPVTADCTVTASFAINTYTVTASAGANGTIAPTSQTVDHGAITHFIITPDTAHHLDSIDGCGGSLSGNTYTTAPVIADCSVMATFAVNPTSSLALTIDDGRDHARYGQILDYVVTVTNQGAGDATGAILANTLPAQLDEANTSWVCLGGDGGAICTASGDGPLNDSGIVIPAGRSLTWLLSTPVLVDAAGATVDNSVNASADGSTVSAMDSNALVVFRAGFDEPSGDGTLVAPIDAETACLEGAYETIDATSLRIVTLPITSAPSPRDTILVARSHSAEGFRIERLHMGIEPLVRLVVVAKNKVERASAWAAIRAGASLGLAIAATDKGGVLLLEGAALPLALPLPEGFADTFWVQPLKGGEGTCAD